MARLFIPVNLFNKCASAVRPQDKSSPLIPKWYGVSLNKEPHTDGVTSARADVRQVILHSDGTIDLYEENKIPSKSSKLQQL